MLSLAAVLVAAAVVFGSIFFAERLNELATGRDASFFYRFTGPMLVAFDMFRTYPWAGAGLTGEPFITNNVMNVYMNSPSFQAAWRISRIADVLTNYVWLHWIYLGLVWGVLTHRGGVGLAAPAGRAQRALLLGRLDHPRPGVRRLCRPQDVDRDADRGGRVDPGGQCAGAATHEPADGGVLSEPAILQPAIEGSCLMNDLPGEAGRALPVGTTEST